MKSDIALKQCLAGVLLVLSGACSTVSSLPLIGEREKSATQQPEAEPVAAAVEPSETPDAPPVPKYLVSDLLGLNGRQLDTLLGPAALVRREGVGEYRRYDNKVCNLVVVLSQDASGRILSTMIDTSAFQSSLEKPEMQTCLNGF